MNYLQKLEAHNYIMETFCPICKEYTKDADFCCEAEIDDKGGPIFEIEKNVIIIFSERELKNKKCMGFSKKEGV